MLTAAHVQQGSWDAAEKSIEVARSVWARQDLRDVKTTTMLVSGVSAYMYARAGQHSLCRADVQRAEAVLTGVSPVAPWAAVLVEAFISRAHVLLDKRPDAVSSAERARKGLGELPESPFLDQLVESADQAIARSDDRALLTQAERRVWPLLAGRLTVREIATELHVSPETVKSHVTSIYRKLGISTRRELQDRADRQSLSDL